LRLGHSGIVAGRYGDFVAGQTADLGRNGAVFGIKTPFFAPNLTKFDDDFEVVLLIMKELSAILRPK
jgi:hypothetical protein